MWNISEDIKNGTIATMAEVQLITIDRDVPWLVFASQTETTRQHCKEICFKWEKMRSICPNCVRVQCTMYMDYIT